MHAHLAAACGPLVASLALHLILVAEEVRVALIAEGQAQHSLGVRHCVALAVSHLVGTMASHVTGQARTQTTSDAVFIPIHCLLHATAMT